MELKQLYEDDDAVSPVIGVILMVAITVILAAVIASFVLGLGNSATNTNPQASFSFEYEQIDENADSNTGVATISHDGGDTISDNELYVRGAGFNGTALDATSLPGSGWTGTASGFGASTSNAQNWFETESGVNVDMSEAGSWNGTKSGDDSAVVSGDRANVYVSSDYEVSVVYQAQEGDTSSTLNEQSGPDA